MFVPLVAEATELMNRVPVIWIELQDCAGNSEALLRSSAPTVDDLLFDVLSLEYHETLQACAGHDADKQLEEAAHLSKVNIYYLLRVQFQWLWMVNMELLVQVVKLSMNIL